MKKQLLAIALQPLLKYQKVRLYAYSYSPLVIKVLGSKAMIVFTYIQ